MPTSPLTSTSAKGVEVDFMNVRSDVDGGKDTGGDVKSESEDLE